MFAEVDSMSKKSGQRPLLFIDQPFTRTPSDYNMQEVYTNKRELGQKELEQELGQRDKRKPKKGAFQELVPIELSANETQTADDAATHHEKSHSSFKRVKSFKEMNLTERLDYLFHFPKVLPPVPCVFFTTHQNYQGYLTNYENDQVTIQFHDQTTKTIPVAQITNVIMIGINR
jgi:hypothetical protein